MFEKYKGTISLCEVFKNDYNYIFQGNYSDLYYKSFIEIESNGVNALYWINYNNEKYLFKEIEDDYNLWGELISEEIAKFFNIPCAEYRLATLENKKGILTKNFLKTKETLVLGSELFQEYINQIHRKNNINSVFENKDFLKKFHIPDYFQNLDINNQRRYLFNYLNNFNDVSEILKSNHKIQTQETTEILKRLFQMLIFDLITIQTDRHPNNWGIIENEKKHLPIIIFDNTTCLGLGYTDMKRRVLDFRNQLLSLKFSNDTTQFENTIYQNRNNFTYTHNDIIDYKTRTKKTPTQILKIILESENLSHKDYIYSFIENIPDDFIEKIISKVEKKHQIEMPNELYFYISNIFNYNLNSLKYIIDIHRRSSIYGKALK